MGRVTDLIVPFFFAEWPASLNGFRYSWPFAWSQGVSKIPKSIYHDFSLPVFAMFKNILRHSEVTRCRFLRDIFSSNFFALGIAEGGFLKEEETPRIKKSERGGKEATLWPLSTRDKNPQTFVKIFAHPPPLPQKLESDAPLIGASSSNPRFPWSIFMACARKKKQRGRDLRSGGHLWKWPGRAVHGIPQIKTCRFFKKINYLL